MLMVDGSGGIRVAHVGRAFETIEDAAEALLKPVLFPLLVGRPPIAI